MIVKCRHCPEGYRLWVGNCVICGWGPAPGAIDPLPKTKREKAAALKELREADNRLPNHFLSCA
jgi:hypothetical protein